MVYQGPRNGPRSSDQRQLPLACLAEVRAVIYRLFSQAFLYPADERFKAVAAAARDLERESDTLVRFAFFPQWSEWVRFLNGLDRQGVEKVRAEYISLFAANARGVPCPPYESVYREPAGPPTGWLLVQVEREYSAVGLAPSPGLADLPDHVAVELEFMAVLCWREGQAWEQRSSAQGADVLRKEKAFLDSHLGLWLPDFARDVIGADSTGYYTCICRCAQAFVAHDADLVDALLESIQ